MIGDGLQLWGKTARIVSYAVTATRLEVLSKQSFADGVELELNEE